MGFYETFAGYTVIAHEFDCRASDLCEDMLKRTIKSRRLIYESREIIARADVLLERTATLLRSNGN
jgi:hypothetical protein